MQQAPDHDLDIASKEQRLKELAQERRAEQATSRPPEGHQQATSKPPAGHQQATSGNQRNRPKTRTTEKRRGRKRR